MSFTRLPDRMAGYATWELAERLAKLTPQQRDAIDRIVQHVYIENQPWADLFRGDDRICAETNYYRRGKVNEATGKVTKPGWGHDKDFTEALDHARKLALQAQERERLGWLQRAKQHAEASADAAVGTWVQVMNASRNDFARIDAAQKVIDLAFKGAGESTDTGANLEADWWAAAGDGDE